MICVYLNDSGKTWNQAMQNYHNADVWASTHCRSYQGHHVQDVTDFSLIHDLVAQYRFVDQQDVMVFKLKWL